MALAKLHAYSGIMLRFSISATAVIAAIICKVALARFLHVDLPVFLLFFPAVVLCAMYLGRTSGLIAAALSALTANVWGMSPYGEFKLNNPSYNVSLVLFLIFCAIICVFVDRHREGLKKTEALEHAHSLKRAELEAALESMTDAVFVADRDGKFVDFNSAAAKYFRFQKKSDSFSSLADMRGVIDVHTMQGEPVPLDLGPTSRALRGETADGVQLSLRRRDTGESWIGSYSYAPIRNAGGEVTGAVVVARDISEVIRTQEALEVSELRYRTAFQTSLDAIALTRMVDGTYVDVNHAFGEVLGYSPREIIGRNATEINVWVEPEQRINFIEAIKRNECREFQARFRRKGGEIFWGVVSSSPFRVQDATYLYSVIRDVSKAKIAEEKIRTLAFFDPLTGLANRRLLLEQLRKSALISMHTHRKRALLFIDLDNFKSVNESLGYMSGDMLLREVAQRLNACVREADTVGRVGGDEFAVILEDLGDTSEYAAASASATGEKILAQIDQIYMLSGRELAMTCSIGITIFGDDLENVPDILRQAEIAARQAKEAGKNIHRFFAPALQASVDARATMEGALRQAIRFDQFMLYYQPQFEDGRLVGAEALLRWNHPTMGILPPGGFITLAEETRLIIPLGNWVLEAACNQLKAWSRHPQRSRLKIAVNISAMQLGMPDFVNSVLDILQRTGVDPRRLRLELTESMLVSNVEDTIAKMTSLRALGVGFALDDFGTGYSSLAYLRRLPVDQLKIDRSFVSDILHDPSCAAIAQTIISLSRAMGLPVIAEGVETAEQLAFLEDLGCRTHQGYYFSPPLPIDDFECLMPAFADRVMEDPEEQKGMPDVRSSIDLNDSQVTPPPV